MSFRKKLIIERARIDEDSARTPFEATVFDTSIGSQNRGDQIISRAVYQMLGDLFPHAHLWSLPTHDTFGAAGRKRQRHSLFSITTGTNLLSPRLPGGGLWKIPLYFRPSLIPFGRLYPKNLVLCAVGSNAQELSPAGTRFLRQSLWSGVPISARDNATVDVLSRAGIRNVLHTSCVTLWNLRPDHTDLIPKTGANAVVVTFTGTRRASHEYVEADRALIEIVRNHYDRVYYWPQGQVDLEYLAMIDMRGVIVLPGSLDAFTELLASREPLDYIGARLHAGIHALMHNRRTVIIAVDNRASDIATSTGLPVILAREVSAQLPHLISSSWPTALSVPRENIDLWKRSLTNSVRSALGSSIDLSSFQPK
jgi:polysaccharide pyruvyl transferase WcaK-like protein